MNGENASQHRSIRRHRQHCPYYRPKHKERTSEEVRESVNIFDCYYDCNGYNTKCKGYEPEVNQKICMWYAYVARAAERGELTQISNLERELRE